MTGQNDEEKTEKPTPKKREDVRKKGEVAKSRELPSVAVLLAGLLTLSIIGSYIYGYLKIVFKESYSLMCIKHMDVSDFILFAENMINLFIMSMIPFMAAIIITAVFSNVAQVGFMLSGESIKPKLSKLDPIKGFGRLFSKHSFMELLKSLLKLTIVSAVAYVTVKAEMANVPHLGEMELPSISSYTLNTIFKISLRCTLAMIFLVAVDYAFQKWEFEKRIGMTKKEIKDEFKRTEGDPLVKSRIKSIQMQMARKRMMQEVPRADVVITNPTHFAVALKYDSTIMGAPKILAKGAGEVAKRIKILAMENNIPVVENKELAQSLHALVEIGQEIPPALYQAVAEVLAYIYRLKNGYNATG